MRRRASSILSALAVVIFCNIAYAASFDELRVSGPCDVALLCRPDSAGMVFVEPGGAEDSSVDVRRADGALYVTVMQSVTKRLSIKVYADDDISVIMVSKRCRLSADGFKSEGSMSLSATTASSLTLSSLSASIISVSLTGNGRIDMTDDISASAVNLSLVGSGKIVVHGLAAATLSLTQRGSGDITVTGSARKSSMVGFGTGTIDVSKLISAEMNIKQFGSGQIFYPAGVRATIDGESENIRSVKPYQPL